MPAASDFTLDLAPLAIIYNLPLESKIRTPIASTTDSPDDFRIPPLGSPLARSDRDICIG